MVAVLVMVMLVERKVLVQQNLVAQLLRVENVVHELRSENERREVVEMKKRETFAPRFALTCRFYINCTNPFATSHTRPEDIIPFHHRTGYVAMY